MDALIVGGGVIGAAVARELARRGVGVTLIAGRPLAESATAAAVGTLSYSPSAPMPEGWHLLARHSLTAHRELSARLAKEVPEPPVYHWPGRLNVTTTNAAEKNSRDRLKADQAAGDGGAWLDKKAIHDLEPALSTRVQGGSFKAGQGWVNAVALTTRLLEATRQYGAKVVEKMRVTHLLEEEGVVRGVQAHPLKKTTYGKVNPPQQFYADVTIIAAGVWSGEVDARFPLPLEPVRGQAVHVNLYEGPQIRHLISGNGIYMIPEREGVTIGATHEKVGLTYGVTVGGITRLLHNAIALLPHLGDIPYNEIEPWFGFRPATPDKVPIIGPDPRTKGLWWATGHFRSGILLAPRTARILANALLENADLSPLWSPARFIELAEGADGPCAPSAIFE